MGTHSNSVDRIKVVNKLLPFLIDSGSDKSFINQKLTVHGKKEKMSTSTTWLTGAGNMTTKTNC